MAFPMRAPSGGTAHLLSIADLDPDEITDVLDEAAALKAGRRSVPGIGPGTGVAPMEGVHVALLFDKPSLRTRVSFEVGIQRLGCSTTTLSGSEIGLGSREPLPDIARTLSRYVDAIVVRMLSDAGLAELAEAADVPVVNALTEHEHPCQALADLLTLREHLGGLHGRRLAYVGDGNNVCHSLLLGGAAVGLHVRVACPPGHEPDPGVVDRAIEMARRSGAHIEVVHDPARAVADADAVYTDVWASMGSEHEAAERRRRFAGFRVTAELHRGAPGALVMHCLPAHRGEEIDGDVIDGPRSVVFDQAENRMYVQQAVLLHLLRQRRGTFGRRPHVVPALGAVGALRH
jgi:ornithine carbamoyltransferase